MYSITKSGVIKKLESWSLIIPLHDNDGKKFSQEEIDKVLESISLNYPGYTIVSCIGFWKDQQQTFKDENFQIIIDAAPTDTKLSTEFFSKLKHELSELLRQEKIYITKTDSKEELLSFKEFFKELGLEVDNTNISDDNYHLAEQLVSNHDLIFKRLGYETVVLIRDKEQKKIMWERKICGLRLKSEFDDNLPEDAILVGADQIDSLGDAIFSSRLIVLVGNYEFQKYILEKIAYRPLVEVNLQNINNVVAFRDQKGIPITTKKFIELFTMCVFSNYMVLRDENYLSSNIKINVGSDGSMQIGESKIHGNNVLVCQATIHDKNVQLEIMRCLDEAVKLFEENKLDPIAILQTKARNNYIKNRALIRKSIKEHDAPQ